LLALYEREISIQDNDFRDCFKMHAHIYVIKHIYWINTQKDKCLKTYCLAYTKIASFVIS